MLTFFIAPKNESQTPVPDGDDDVFDRPLCIALCFLEARAFSNSKSFIHIGQSFSPLASACTDEIWLLVDAPKIILKFYGKQLPSVYKRANRLSLMVHLLSYNLSIFYENI